MTFWDNIKGIFSRRETPDRKIARLSETRVGLSQQREKVYELIGNLEKKEVELTSGFAQASALAQRRIATEVASIRADMQRRHQLLSAIDKKINVVNAAMHRLEMEQQVNPGSLQPLEALSQPSEQLEEGMAMLDQMDEDAEIDAEAGMSALSDNAQGVFEELKARTTPPAIPMTGSEAKSSATSPTRKTQAANDASLNQPRRADAEPG
jgi:chromosome segregation ATPase